MTGKRFTIVDEEFISYYGGTGHKISNGECGFWLWHSKEESQKVCDKLNELNEENEKLRKENEQLEERVKQLQINNRVIKKIYKTFYKPRGIKYD